MKIMSFKDFVHKYNLRNEATSNVKIYEVFKKIGLDSKVGVYLTDGDFSSNCGILNLHPSKGTHWVCYIEECYFDSYGCPPLKKFLITFKVSIENVFILNIRFEKKIIFVVVMFYM